MVKIQNKTYGGLSAREATWTWLNWRLSMPYGPQINERPAGLTADRIVDTALALAEQRSWEATRLYDVAVAVGIPLDDIRHNFREKEDLVDGWFDRADQAMLKAAEQPEFFNLSPRQRLHR